MMNIGRPVLITGRVLVGAQRNKFVKQIQTL